MFGLAAAVITGLPGMILESGPWSWLAAGMLLAAGPAIAAAQARENRLFEREFAALADEYPAGARTGRRER